MTKAMLNDEISARILQYLSTPMPSYAILLRGDWGVGKSFYWQRFTNKMPHGKHAITFSVAGLASLEEIERALLLASIEDFCAGLLRETGSVVGRALLRWIKVEPKDINLKADVKPDHTVVCIDDVERFAGHFKVLFGFIISLLDDAKLHVVLIADEGRARILDGYNEYKERIIARSLDVRAPIDAFYEHVVGGYADQLIREALFGAKNHALLLLKDKRITI